MRIARLVLLWSLWCAHAYAQTGPRTGGPAPGDFVGRRAAIDLSVTGNLARGLVDRDLISGRGAMTYWSGPWGVFVQPYYMYGDVKLGPVPRVKTDDERYLRALLYHTFSRPLFEYGVIAAYHSLRRRIDRRALVGVGLGATLVSTAVSSVSWDVGLLGEDNHFDPNTLPDMSVVPATHRQVARTSMRLYGRYKLPHINVIHDVYLIPNVQDVADLRAIFSGVVEIPLSSGLSARVAIDATYEGYIVPGTEHDDVAITFGLGYRNDWALSQSIPRQAGSSLSPPIQR
jgi:hypothetical protein